MTAELNITWDGTTPGLAEHALSLEHWLKALNALLTAVKRTASQMVSEALDDPDYGVRGGKLKREAANIDLQLVKLGGGSLATNFRCTSPTPQQSDLFRGELPARALERVLDNIEAESRGELRSAMARRYLEAVPRGVTTQTYRLVANGHSKTIVIKDPQLATPPDALPTLRRFSGEIVSIGVAAPSVTVKEPESRQQLFTANEDQVETAFALRHGEVVATCTFGEPQRLVLLEPIEVTDPDVVPPSPPIAADERTRIFLSRWARTLEILGR